MISRFVFAGAERGPERLAIVAGGRRLSYGEFARAIEAMVQAFEGGGIAGPGYAVLAVADLLEGWVIALALRELGLTTVPVLSADNAQALALKDVRAVVTHPDETWPGLEALCARLGWPLVRARWGGAFARPIEAGRLRVDEPGEHVLQTSATTGAYKKVLMARAFEATFMERRRVNSEIDERTRAALFNFGGWTGAGYKSAGSIWLAGGCIVCHQGPDLARCLDEPDLTQGVLLPDQLNWVLAAPEGALRRQPGMRLYLGGATPSQAQIDEARRRITPDIWNSLGATETLTFAQTPMLTIDDRRWHRLAPERDPQIVDEADRPVAMGQVGRVRVSTRDGPTSYLDDPVATAAFFKDGYFYPGDLGVIREDGRMALMGRTTEVINVLGQKISPAPYEDEIRERLGVSDVCLFSRQSPTGDEEMHVVIETTAPLDMRALTGCLQGTLGGFPHADVHYLAALPRNASGKVLRTEVQRLVQARRGDA